MLAELNAKMYANMVIIKSTINALKEKMGPNPEENEAIVEHQDIPAEDVAVMPVKGLRKQRRVLNLAADSRQKRKGGTQKNCGSRRKSDVACRKVSHHATVASCT
jgi:hypothetical protein